MNLFFPSVRVQTPRFSRGRRPLDTSSATSTESEEPLAVIVNASPRTAYERWTAFDSVPHFMQGRQAHVAPEGLRIVLAIRVGPRELTWDAELTDDSPGHRIGWRSVGGDFHPHSGQIIFDSYQEGQTRITVDLEFGPQVSIAKREPARSCVRWILDKFAKSLRTAVPAQALAASSPLS